MSATSHPMHHHGPATEAQASLNRLAFQATPHAKADRQALAIAFAAGPLDWFFWTSMAFALAIAFAVALPINLWLFRSDIGHAVVHAQH